MTNQRRTKRHVFPGTSRADASCARDRSGAERLRLIVLVFIATCFLAISSAQAVLCTGERNTEHMSGANKQVFRS